MVEDSLYLLNIGAAGLEPTTSCTPCKRATRLRYSPNKEGSQSAMEYADASGFSIRLRHLDPGSLQRPIVAHFRPDAGTFSRYFPS